MILVLVPDLNALRHWMLRLDAKLVTPEMQQRWLMREREAQRDAKTIKLAMQSLGLKRYTMGGDA